MYSSFLNDVAVVIPAHTQETELKRLVETIEKLAPEIEVHTVFGTHRAFQLNQGILRTNRRFLWFLHADSVLSRECIIELDKCLQKNPHALYYFRLGFQKDGPRLVALNGLGANYRSVFLKLPFGDQGFCLSKTNVDILGGFDERASYGEDHLLVWKARRKGIPLIEVNAKLFTSARKYAKKGWLRTTVRHLDLTCRQAIPEWLKLVKSKVRGKGAVAIFVKTPGLSPIKTRLASSIGKERAENVYLQLVQLIEKVALDASRKLSLSFYWAVAEEEGGEHPLWKKLPILYQGEGSLGERISKIYNELLKLYDYVFLIGADCPDLDLNRLEKAVKRMRTSNCVLGRTADGGFYLFGGRQPIDKEVWTKIPYSSNTTAQCLFKELEPFGPVSELEELYDVDTVQDLQRLGWTE